MTAAVSHRYHGGGGGPGHPAAQSDHDMSETLRHHVVAHVVPPAGAGVRHDCGQQRVERGAAEFRGGEL